MNQNEFFNILMDGLKDFPEIKLQDIISYYENNFTLGLASGKTEAEIINELGNPNFIVDKYRKEDLETPINSETLINDSEITPINNQNSIADLNSDNNSITNDPNFIENQNIITDNNYNDKKNDFETNNKLNAFKTSDSYEDINLTSNFYELDNSNASNPNFTGESDFNANNKTKDHSNYKSYSSNYNFNNKQNSNSNSNNFNNQNSKNTTSQFNVNTILKICIVILALIIFFPVITGIIGCILGLFGIAIGILVGSIGLLVGGTFTNFVGLPNVPMFVADFPYPVIVLFSLGSISLSIILALLFYYLCKFLILISIKAYKSLKSKGGAF